MMFACVLYKIVIGRRVLGKMIPKMCRAKLRKSSMSLFRVKPDCSFISEV